MPQIHSLGFPRIGKQRELKFALERYWAGQIDQATLQATGRELRLRHWAQQAQLNFVPVGDFAWYDQVLTLSATLDVIPKRHRQGKTDLDTLFRVARGRGQSSCGSCAASEMTKWFDTNYHYLVPEFETDQQFRLGWRQIIEETAEARAAGYNPKPVVLGPLSYLWLGKFGTGQSGDKLSLLAGLLPVYRQLLTELKDAGAEWVQIDEPILALDLPDAWRAAFEGCYHQLQVQGQKLLLAVYFGELKDNLSTAINLPVAGLHVDAVRARAELARIVDRLSAHKVLSVGIVDGRNIWRTDLDAALELLEPIKAKLGERLWLAPSCSLLHSPYDVEPENSLPEDVKPWFAFAVQKLEELKILQSALKDPGSDVVQKALAKAREIQQARAQSSRVNNPALRKRLQQLSDKDAVRATPFSEREKIQQQAWQFPLLPTTTIGSFPQTPEIRKARANFKKGILNQQEYKSLMRAEIARAIKEQEKLGLDVLVHGEAERNDMVEYFGEQLEGYVFSANGWVQSYGSRCVKPPIIVGDISRPHPMTAEWATFAQSLTQKPVKGMLTGPITMLCWSFVRDDQPRKDTAVQLALAIRDEVQDLEAAGIGIIQIDEPALREGLPLRKSEWPHYLEWATHAFRLASSGVTDRTQIHTHMCYCEFNDIIESISALDADVITIETSRSNMELLNAFEHFAYPNQIGPGVYDIHSPNLPDQTWVEQLIEKAAQKIPARRLWVNPDCGLKTRSWEETRTALEIMVQATRALRKKLVATAA